MTAAFFCMGMPYLCYNTREKQTLENSEKSRHLTLRLPQEESSLPNFVTSYTGLFWEIRTKTTKIKNSN
jgi:hypothetical protein